MGEVPSRQEWEAVCEQVGAGRLEHPLPVDEEWDETAEALVVPVGKLEHREAV
jgi:hypothetical protein